MPRSLRCARTLRARSALLRTVRRFFRRDEAFLRLGLGMRGLDYSECSSASRHRRGGEAKKKPGSERAEDTFRPRERPELRCQYDGWLEKCCCPDGDLRLRRPQRSPTSGARESWRFEDGSQAMPGLERMGALEETRSNKKILLARKSGNHQRHQPTRARGSRNQPLNKKDTKVLQRL